MLSTLHHVLRVARGPMFGATFVGATLVVSLAAPRPAAAADFTAGHLFLADLDADAVVELDEDGAFVRRWGEDAGLVDPRGLAFGPDGLLYVTSGDRVFALDADDQVARTVGEGTALAAPRGLAFGPAGRLYATSTDRVLAFDDDGQVVQSIGEADGLFVPVGLAFGPDGALFVASGGANTVFVFEPGGRKVGEIGGGSTLGIPGGVAIDPRGRLLVTSLFSSALLTFDADGAEELAATDEALALPAGVAIGPDGNRYVTSLVSGAVAVFDADGAFVGEADAGGEFGAAEGLAFAPARRKSKIKGTLTLADGGRVKLAESATLVYSAGTRELSVRLADGDLAAALGGRGLTFMGFVQDGNGSGKSHLLHGVAITGDGHAGSAAIEAKGKLATTAFGDTFRLKAASGTISLSSGGFVFRGSLATK